MSKIPVGETIAFAYRFTFANVGTIIGLAWLPLVILAVLNFLPDIAGGADSTSALATGSQAIGSLAILILTLLLYAIIYVPVTKQALGLRQGSATIHFALGMPEYRVFGAIFLLFGLMLVLASTFLGVLSIFVVSSGGGTNAVLAIATQIFAIAGLCGFIYAFARLGFLVTPITVVEERISLARGWLLTEGNFWRIVGVTLAIVGPMLVLYLLGAVAVTGGELFAPVPAAIAKNGALLIRHQMEIIQRHKAELLGIELIFAPFTLGLNLSAAAFAYRALAKNSPAPKVA